MPDWLAIPVGLITLVVSAELLVRGSVGMALTLGISKLVVGLTIVAFGTSAPELVVCVADVMRDQESVGGVALGTVYGSNLANIGLILGLTAVARSVQLGGPSLRFEAGWLMVVTALTVLPPVVHGGYVRAEGAVLVALLVVFTALLVRREKRGKRLARKRLDTIPDSEASSAAPVESTPEKIGRRFLGNAVLALVGLFALRLGGGWLVDGCSGLASSLGVTESLIAATVVAIGSSLPELATALVAARRGHPELILGNIVGSNIFNICLVLGVSTVLRPLPVPLAEHGLRLGLGLVFAVALALLMLTRDRIGRPAGLLLLLSYLGYVTMDALRG